MTIGIGFLCSDGIVICADRQLTGDGGFKFEERKIFYSIRESWSCIFSYAGDPDAAQIMFRKTTECLKAIEATLGKPRGKSDRDKVRLALEKTFNSRHSSGIQSLIGIRFKSSSCCLFKTSKKKVVDAHTEYIGGGDSSALRYVCDFLLRDVLTVSEAEVIGSYIVSVANRYIDGCGGGPDISMMHADGKVGESTGGVFPNQRERFLQCEAEIGKELRTLLLSGGRVS